MRHRGRIGMGDMGGGVLSPTLILRFADVGVATYASLRVVEEPARTLTWVVKGVDVDAVLDELGQALPEPTAGEPVADALARALRRARSPPRPPNCLLLDVSVRRSSPLPPGIC